MKLQLIWKKDREYKLGILEKEQEYIFKINEKELKCAIEKGCMGIGNFDFLKNEYRSNELFSFFKNRIPEENNINIKEILEEYEIKSYDEMELLKKTKGQLLTDNYYLIEVE